MIESLEFKMNLKLELTHNCLHLIVFTFKALNETTLTQGKKVS